MKNFLTLIFISIIFISCGKNNTDPTMRSGSEQINGAGATFPFPIYSKWIAEYQKIDPSARINYQSIGSGGGIRQITEKTVDFGASDNPMNREQVSEANSKNKNTLLQVPTLIGSVVLTYNVPGVPGNLNLSQDAIAKIFLGEVKKWNDPVISSNNPDVNLPDKDIIVCYRSDGSGTTYVFTDFLSKISETWKNGPGTGQSIRFPVGQGAKGNEGVTGLVKQIENSIGYVEFVYAVQNNLGYANVQNTEGNFIEPTIESLTNAAEFFYESLPEDLGQSITNSGGENSYPISSYTYIMLYENQDDQNKGKRLKGFLNWAVTDGKQFAIELGYAPLPDPVIARVQTRLNLIKYNGEAL